jgi:hypothetical protein
MYTFCVDGLRFFINCIYLQKKLFCNAGPPTCHSLEFLGSMIEGQRVSFIASYSGGSDITTFHI